MKVLFTLLAGCAFLTAFCEKENADNKNEVVVPAALQAAFVSEYPSAKSVSWDMEGSNYEAEFMDEAVERAIVYTPDAAVVYRAREVAPSSLPARIREYVASAYSRYEIEEAERIDRAEGTVQYELEIEKGNKELELLFDADGAFIKELEDDDDGKGDDD